MGICFSISAQEKRKVPPPPPPVIVKVNSSTPTHLHDFYNRNPTVGLMTWKTANRIIVLLKNKNQEEYLMSDELQKNKFIEKYGEPIPMPPPPPPPKPMKKTKRLS